MVGPVIARVSRVVGAAEAAPASRAAAAMNFMVTERWYTHTCNLVEKRFVI